MAITLQASISKKSSVIIIPFVKGEVDHLKVETLTGIKTKKHFTGDAKEKLPLFDHTGKQKIILLGLGDKSDSNRAAQILRSCLFSLRGQAKGSVDVDCYHLNSRYSQSMAAGALLSTYSVGHYKTTAKTETYDVNIVVEKSNRQAANIGLHEGGSQMMVMELIDQPSNIKTPSYIANTAVKSGKKWGYTVKVYDEPQLIKMGVHALLAVGQGSTQGSRLIVMEYKPKSGKSKFPTLGMVGKGVSFDTGGVSIKPSTNMGFMKSDMSGAAAVIGAMELAARLKLNIHVVGVVPSAENAVDGNSIRPGDVISSYSGKSIEVIDTDAEGRLVLADGIAYMLKHHHPEYLVDLATLTGSCVATLGNIAAGLFTGNDKLAEMITQAGAATAERVWRLPLWDDYASEMNSDIADIKNLSTKPVAGAITAAKFLEYFTEGHTQWAHLDIAGVAFTDSEFAKSRSASAYGVRLLGDLMAQLIAKGGK
jgi:leucyl aminopeptidase